jgi:hypothetical protein
MEPTADFLLNVKAGHCERFAAALALALRGLGVPSRVIKGYRGAEEEGEGAYVIRADQAHAWVQVLLHSADGGTWVMLDPTPGQAEERNPLTTWLSWMSDLDAVDLWYRFVLNYNSDVQSHTMYYLVQGVWQSPSCRRMLWVPTGLAVALGLLALARRRGAWVAWLRRTHGGPGVAVSPPSFYRKFLRVLARRLDLHPQGGQTPLEFATSAAPILAQLTGTAALSALPAQVAQALYLMRFSEHGLDVSQHRALEEQVAALDASLART